MLLQRIPDFALTGSMIRGCHDLRLFFHYLLDEDLIPMPPTLIHYIFTYLFPFSPYVSLIHDKQRTTKEDRIQRLILQLRRPSPTIWRWNTITTDHQVRHISSLMLFIIMNRSLPHRYQYLLWRRSLWFNRSQRIILGIVKPNVDGTAHQLLTTLTILSLERMNVRSYQTRYVHAL